MKVDTFVLSHKRADSIKTVDTLRKCGYSGEIFVVCDDSDIELEKYRLKFSDCLRVFSKESIECDSMDLGQNKSTPLYARNYCLDVAKSKYVFMLDDDITAFNFRYIEDGKLKSKPVEKMDRLIGSVCEFMECDERIASCGFAFSGEYFGGADGKYKDGLGRLIQQAFILRTNFGGRFCGTINEDVITEIKHLDRLFFSTYSVAVDSPQRRTNKGGIEYESLYIDNSYLVMYKPSCFEMGEGGVVRKKVDLLFPKILSSRVKK